MNPKYKIKWNKLWKNYKSLWYNHTDFMVWTHAIVVFCSAVSLFSCLLIAGTTYGAQWNDIYLGGILGGIPFYLLMLVGLFLLSRFLFKKTKTILSDLFKGTVTKDTVFELDELDLENLYCYHCGILIRQGKVHIERKRYGTKYLCDKCQYETGGKL